MDHRPLLDELRHATRFVIVGTLLYGAACTERPAAIPTAPAGPDKTLDAAADTDLVATPSGWYHRDCIFAVPNGSHIDVHHLVRRPDGSAFQLPLCKHPGRVQRGFTSELTPSGGLFTWVEWTSYSPGTLWGEIDASWHVPTLPLPSPYGVVNDTPQVFFAFPGIQSKFDTGATILQPVLTYGGGAGYGGNFWTATSWACGHVCMHGSTVLNVTPGDSMFGSVTASNCVNGSCTWTIVTRDGTRGIASSYSIDDTSGYRYAVGGSMEAHGLTTCSEFPAAGVFFTGIVLKDQSGHGVSPAWTPNPATGFTPSCAFAVSSTATTASLADDNGPALILSGPTTGKPFSRVTVTAAATTGDPPYTYTWRIQGGTGSCGNQSTCTATLGAGGTSTNFFAQVTDSKGLVAAAEWTVNSCANALVVAASHGPFASLAFKC